MGYRGSKDYLPGRTGLLCNCVHLFFRSRSDGFSPQPLKTDEGWLILYHGVNTLSNRSIYRLGLALLDLENPSKLIARSDEWVFGPELTYEKLGDNVKVVYPCGWVLVNGIIKLYYGGADTCIAMASASLAEVLSWLKKYSCQ